MLSGASNLMPSATASSWPRAAGRMLAEPKAKRTGRDSAEASAFHLSRGTKAVAEERALVFTETAAQGLGGPRRAGGSNESCQAHPPRLAGSRVRLRDRR